MRAILYSHRDLRELEGDEFHLGNVQIFLAAFFGFRNSSFAEKFSDSRNSHGDLLQFTVVAAATH